MDRGASPLRAPVLVSQDSRACKNGMSAFGRRMLLRSSPVGVVAKTHPVPHGAPISPLADTEMRKRFHVVPSGPREIFSSFPESHSTFESARSSSRTAFGQRESGSQHVTLTSGTDPETSEESRGADGPEPWIWI